MLRSPSQDDGRSDLTRLLAAVEASGDVLYEWDLATDRLQWAGAAASLFGDEVRAHPRCGDELNGRISPEDLPRRMSALAEHFGGVRDYDCEYRVRGPSGDFHWVHDRGAVSFSATGTPERLAGVLRLVTQRKQNEAKLEYLANFDDLTGHFNKVRLREALDHALAQGMRFNLEGAFLMIGLDQVGRINADYGHEAGDRVLFEIGQRLDNTLRTADTIGRLDSDCFGVVLTASSEAQARRAAERVLEVVRATPVAVGGGAVRVTASVGIALYPTHAQTAFSVILTARDALMEAKAGGRDRICVHQMTEDQRRDHRDRLSLGEDVKMAIKEHRLTLAYQPVVDARSGAVSFYECLLRMRTRDGALVPAERFVPVVEHLGLVRTLDRRALDLAMGVLGDNPDVKLAVNISGLTVDDRAWLRALTVRLKDRPDLARRLIVEITETAALHDIEESAHFITAVRGLGCQVAVDDFGAGYTTFRHLKSLTVDVVKIDGSFVRNLDSNGENQLFIRNLLNLARTFGLTTVAECVETAEDAAYLRKEGVELLQGHYFGKPQVSPPWEAAEVTREGDLEAPSRNVAG